MRYTGGCHCEQNKFEAEGTIEQVIPDGAKMAAINVRCLRGIDLDKLKRVPFDGRNL